MTDRNDAFSSFMYRTGVALKCADHPAEQDYFDIYEHYRDDKFDTGDLITYELEALLRSGEREMAFLLVENLVRSVRGQPMVWDKQEYENAGRNS